ncbi:MAG TPA: GNAT family N-acetyltransferase, partial [Syntrophobacteraceae bacterium]|nr:GNAT family N-acetyltransferase [Syntrophobacteraceae bacterium]
FMCRESMRSPYIRTDSDWDAFLKSTDVKFRKQLRNKKNKLSKAGKVTIEEHTTHSPAVLEEVFSVSAKSWKHREGTSMVSTPERRRFFERLSSVASREGWLSIWLLRLDGRPIALEYHLKHQGRTHGMRGDFDEAYREVSPGSVLEAHIIEHCFTHELKEYDFCGLDYRYKTKWTDLVHPTVNLLVYNENFRSLSIYAMQKYLPLVKGIIEKK